jgi:5-methylcytosine-specific restriction endonuclease McrA
MSKARRAFLRGRMCHYCRGQANTRDHIVPRSKMVLRDHGPDADKLGYGASANIVPACIECNQTKRDSRSTCDCMRCTSAWLLFGPTHWSDLPRVDPTTWRLTRA